MNLVHDRGSMDPVHESGPWTWSKVGVHGPLVHVLSSPTETYVGLATNFKERYRNHKTSFRHSKRRNETELSKYVWNLQNENKPFQIKWKILKKCKPYSNINKKCSLCLNEKFMIICKKRTV